MNTKLQTVLEAFYEKETARPDDVFLVQPMAGAEVATYTFAEVGEQSRRMAAYLRSLGLHFPYASGHFR